MIAGACLRAVWKRSRTRAAPTPTNISMKSEPVIEMNGHARLTGDRTRDQRLAGSRRTDEQHALRDARADVLELARHLQEVDDLGDLLLHRAVARDVAERRLRLVGVVDLGARAPDVHHRAHLPLRAARDEPPERADEAEHEREAEDRADEVRRLGLVVDVDVVLR